MAESTVERLRNFRRLVGEANLNGGNSAGTDAKPIVKNAIDKFETAMDDDLNTAAALAAVHDLVREINTILADGKLMDEDRDAVLNAVARFDSVLGIFGKEESDILDAEVEALIAERQNARHDRNFARSDEIRDLLAEKGIILEDTKEGVRWKRR